MFNVDNDDEEIELDIQTPRVFLPLLVPGRYKAIHGGRGGGKSHFFAECAVEDCLNGCDIVCIREVQKSIKESVKRLIEAKIRLFKLEGSFTIKDTEIICDESGKKIIFVGMQNHTADSIKSLEGYDRAWVEEAQTLSQRSLDLLRPTIRKEESEIWFSWNPRYPTDPVDVLFRNKDEPAPIDSIVVQCNYPDNPFFPKVLEQEVKADMERDFDKYQHVWMGEYEQSSRSRVFNNFKVKEFDFDDSEIESYRFGSDFGFADDPTTLVRCFIKNRTLYIDQEAYMYHCEIDQLPDLFATIDRSDDYFITADSARPETISYLRNHGYPKITRSKKGKGSIKEGVEFLKSFDIIIHPRCVETINEFNKYSYKVDKLTDEILPDIIDKFNHIIDALRYACENIRHAMVKHKNKQESDNLDRYGKRYVPSSENWMS